MRRLRERFYISADLLVSRDRVRNKNAAQPCLDNGDTMTIKKYLWLRFTAACAAATAITAGAALMGIRGLSIVLVFFGCLITGSLAA